VIAVLDTNVLVRLFVHDDPAQVRRIEALLGAAQASVVPPAAWCELIWVLRSHYRASVEQLVEATSALLERDDVLTDRAAVEAGLAFLRAGADFADGVIASAGAGQADGVFVSLDRRAVEAAKQLGLAAREP